MPHVFHLRSVILQTDQTRCPNYSEIPRGALTYWALSSAFRIFNVCHLTLEMGRFLNYQVFRLQLLKTSRMLKSELIKL